MKKFSISAALKQKNRIAGELTVALNTIKRDNSRPETKPLRSDIPALLELIGHKSEDLVTIKAAIAAANVPIYLELAKLEEIKARISFFQSLNTTEGEISVGGYNSEKTVKHVAVVNQGVVDGLIAELQKMANDAQDAIDAFNATHYIEVNLS